MVGYSYFPHWLEGLLGEKFFNSCLIHETAKKNEKNIFCLDCCTSICPHCLSPHCSHRLLQIRRYVYRDVVRQDDLEKLIDCSFVQSYITNNAKVIFLNQRPQPRPFRGSGNICTTCDRSLQDPYLFCSLSCKVKYLVRKNGLAKYLYECEFLPLPEYVQMSPTCSPPTELMAVHINRRKAIPHRSPLY
ncbi:protein RGF1 INDUCIBLE TRANSCRIPTION FACTOR 1-like isoform X2 [Tasmannia lanceolata]|uniref:protein RGF1 INDUCIBLE TRANSCRIPTION FACTOR 1-like isoform X2 n=1 Tax=Tasmannia lanceolata TaxID=3420 RepID=UPI004062B0AB